MITAPHVFFHFNLLSKILIITGYLAQGGLLTCFFILLRRRDLMEKLCAKLLWILHKIHLVRDIDKKRLRLEKKMDEYQACVEQMGDRRGALLKAYFWNLMQRVSQISVTMFMFLAIGGNFEDAYNIWATQSMVVIGSNTVPIPGGMGVADYLMLDGFRDILPNLEAIWLEILSRSLSFYICVLVSAITVVLGFIGYRFRKRNCVLIGKGNRI